MNIVRLISLLLLLVCLQLPASLQAKETWQDVARIVAIGDLHGDYEQYLLILKDNNLLDAKLNWQGGKTHLVQLGDVPDRGPDSLKIMRHLKQLHKQARKAKGYVHALLGNHELMNITHDLRYVHPGEYSTLVTDKSAIYQAHYLERVFEFLLTQDPTLVDSKPQSMQELAIRFPKGFVEHRVMWAPKGEAFEWVKKNNAVIKINRTLFTHGGISPHQEFLPLKTINRRIRRVINDGLPTTSDLLSGEQGPLWYRGLARNSSEQELEQLKKMLEYYDADFIVIAHTPTPGAVMQRFDGRVVLVDVGLGEFYGTRRASLLIEGSNRSTIHRGHKISLPDSDQELLDYLVRLSKLDPDPSPLLMMIDRLDTGKPEQNVGTD